ncbi:hypothetical protein [Stecheria intestinalis]|nr:hypothetical protein [Stecheria intestinalis]MDD5882359.1 hypothetical protein [Stecheria intestinalis]
MKNTALIPGSYGVLGTCFVNIHGHKGGAMTYDTCRKTGCLISSSLMPS